jgi:hypothetical protein
MGPGVYNGKTLPHYNLFFCRTCFEMNWDGISPVYEPIFVQRLQERGIELPKRNKNELYPR